MLLIFEYNNYNHCYPLLIFILRSGFGDQRKIFVYIKNTHLLLYYITGSKNEGPKTDKEK